MKRGVFRRDVVLVEKELGWIERKLWRLVFHFHYRKMLLLLVLSVISYFIFTNPGVQGFVSSLDGLEYLGVFFAGMLFAFGFTAPLAIGFFIILDPASPLVFAIVGGLGAMVANVLIFSFIRFSFMDEFKRLENTSVIKGIREEMRTHLSHHVRVYFLYALAGIILASPIPDEMGVVMLAGLTHIKMKAMALMSLIFSTVGIFIMCSI